MNAAQYGLSDVKSSFPRLGITIVARQYCRRFSAIRIRAEIISSLQFTLEYGIRRVRGFRFAQNPSVMFNSNRRNNRHCWMQRSEATIEPKRRLRAAIVAVYSDAWLQMRYSNLFGIDCRLRGRDHGSFSNSDLSRKRLRSLVRMRAITVDKFRQSSAEHKP